jgi:hypothetical protein
MKIKHLILCGAMGLMMVSCSTTKQSAINQLEDFSYELRDHSRYYNVDDWEKAGKKFVSIRDKISKHEFDYTPEEKAKIGRLEGDCAKYMAKGAKEGVFDKLKNIGSEIKGIIQSIMDAFDPTAQ